MALWALLPLLLLRAAAAAAAPAAGLYAFSTLAEWPGDFGGVEGGDALCREAGENDDMCGGNCMLANCC